MLLLNIHFSKWKGSKRLSFLLGGLLGVIVFLMVYGTKVLNFSYDVFLLSGGDLPQHYLGWCFYRYSELTHGIGMFNTMSYPNFTSIIYTDSIPLIEVPFRLLSFLLPNIFQYFGLWALICFFLQGGISTLIFKKYTGSVVLQLLGSLPIILSVPVLLKMFYMHSLASHFVILLPMAYWVWHDNESWSRRDLIAWVGMGALAASIHLYFVPMVAMICVGHSLQKVLLRKNAYPLTNIVAVCVGALAVFLLLGGASNLSYVDDSYVKQQYDMLYTHGANLDAFFNSWNISAFGKSWPIAKEGQGEGIAYFGIGVMLMLLMAISGVFIKIVNGTEERFSARKFCWLLVLILSIMVALGPTVSYHDKVIFEIPYPEFLYTIWGAFRGTGRFIWPAYYILIIWGVRKLLSINPNKYMVTALLAVCCIIQVVDLYPRLESIHTTYNTTQSEIETTLKSDSWDYLGEHYRHVVAAPNAILNRSDIRYHIGYWAKTYHLTLNDFYFARQDLTDRTDEIIETLLLNQIEEDTIYLFNDESLSKAQRTNLYIYPIDGLYVGVSDDISEEIGVESLTSVS